MGYAIQVILTNGRKVNEVYGSFYTSFLDVIDEVDYDEYDYMLETYFDLSGSVLSSKMLMSNIIKGDTSETYDHLMLDKENEKSAKRTLGAVYGYLVRDLALHFGKEIIRNTDRWPMLTQYLADFENRNRSYFPHPFSLDFPHNFFVEYRELDEYEAKYKEKLKEKFPDMADFQKDMDFLFGKAREERLNIFFCNQ